MLYSCRPIGSVDFSLGRIHAESLCDQFTVGISGQTDTTSKDLPVQHLLEIIEIFWITKYFTKMDGNDDTRIQGNCIIKCIHENLQFLSSTKKLGSKRKGIFMLAIFATGKNNVYLNMSLTICRKLSQFVSSPL